MIHIKEVLEQIDMKKPDGSPIPFALKFVKFSRKEKTGGEVEHFEGVEILTSELKKKERIQLGLDEKKRIRRNPNHYKNSTRNLKVPNVDHPVKVNIWLITEFNGKEVIR